MLSLCLSALWLSACGLHLKGEPLLSKQSSDTSLQSQASSAIQLSIQARSSSKLAESLAFYIEAKDNDSGTDKVPLAKISILDEKLVSHANFASQSDTEKRRLSLSVSWSLSLGSEDNTVTRHYDIVRDAYFDYSKDQPLANEKERQYVEQELNERLAAQIYNQAIRQATILLKDLEKPCHETEVAAITTDACTRS